METRLTELLKIKYPIIQSGMAWVAFPPLVAAVSEAGGLGILGAGRMNPAELRQAIREVRERTDKTFGVNILATSPIVKDLVDVMMEEKIPVACYGRGNPSPILERCKPEGIICMPTTGAVRHALMAERDGADAVIVQGLEAGGHASYVATTVLLPLVTSKLKIPVAAAGGFCDGGGLVAAMALGAEGVSMGTRFLVTQESPVPLHIKQHYIQSTENDTIVTPVITGTRCRGLKCEVVEVLERERGATALFKGITGAFHLAREFQVPVWKMILSGFQMKKALGVPITDLAHAAWGSQKMRAAFINGDIEMGFMPCGQVVGRIDDIPTCKELIERIVREAEQILARINERLAQ